ncbi:MAG TPA: hypothetical protein VM364_08720 [Vicinamibacterales bacterium]|nr:hypothetical protein [Vicinamibacterales bacterium]
MRRFLAVLACVLSTPALLAQSQAPAQPAKYVPPVKGTATIEVIQAPSKTIGKEIVTVLKVRNTSSGSINLLSVEEYWYDKKLNMVTGDQYRHKKAPILPGEIVEITLRSPVKPDLYRSQVTFRHANGEVKPTQVKAFK